MGSIDEKKQMQLPLVDFRGVDPSNPASEEWKAAGSALVNALSSYGCAEVIYDRVGPELRDELFGRAVPDLFALPSETKEKNVSADGPFMGYINTAHRAYQSLRIDSAGTPDGVQAFTDAMWSGGNPQFRDTAYAFSRHMQDLAEMMQRMVLESFGLERYAGLHVDPRLAGLRMSEYGTPLFDSQETGMSPHTDRNMFTIICQHRVEGLEVETKDGQWIHVVPLPNSFSVVIGDAFTAWTNGRFQRPFHQVRMAGEGKRYSVLYGTRPSDDVAMKPIEELVDSEHPLRYKPFNYKEYMDFLYCGEGRQYKYALEKYCGLGAEMEA